MICTLVPSSSNAPLALSAPLPQIVAVVSRSLAAPARANPPIVVKKPTCRRDPVATLALTGDREQSGPHATVAVGLHHHRLVLRIYSAQPGWAGAAVGNAIESMIIFFRSMATAIST